MTYPKSPSDITPQWLAGALGADPDAILSVDVEFVGDAIGNTSNVYFVRPKLRPGTDLPRSFVAKMVPEFEGAIEVCRALRLFEREIEIYRNVAGPTDIRTPTLYWSDYDPETSLGFMLMEDCSACSTFDQTRPVPSTIDELHRIIEASARLHAKWFRPREVPRGVLAVGDPVRTVFFAMIRDTWASLLSGGPGAETIPDSGKPVARAFMENLVRFTEEKWTTGHDTIIHLDFRLDNMFVDPDTGEPVIFDWQGASLGRGAFDIAYVLATGYDREFRRAHEDELIRHYHRTLVDEGVTDYALDDIRRDYRLGTVFNLWVVPFTALLDLSSERGQALTRKIIGGIFETIRDHDGEAAFREHLEND